MRSERRSIKYSSELTQKSKNYKRFSNKNASKILSGILLGNASETILGNQSMDQSMGQSMDQSDNQLEDQLKTNQRINQKIKQKIKQKINQEINQKMYQKVYSKTTSKILPQTISPLTSTTPPKTTSRLPLYRSSPSLSLIHI